MSNVANSYYTNPNCQRNKVLCCNCFTRRGTAMNLRIFLSYTMIFKSVYTIVMVSRDSLNKESRVQNPFIVLHVQHLL